MTFQVLQKLSNQKEPVFEEARTAIQSIATEFLSQQDAKTRDVARELLGIGRTRPLDYIKDDRLPLLLSYLSDNKRQELARKLEKVQEVLKDKTKRVGITESDYYSFTTFANEVKFLNDLLNMLEGIPLDHRLRENVEKLAHMGAQAFNDYEGSFLQVIQDLDPSKRGPFINGVTGFLATHAFVNRIRALALLPERSWSTLGQITSEIATLQGKKFCESLKALNDPQKVSEIIGAAGPLLKGVYSDEAYKIVEAIRQDPENLPRLQKWASHLITFNDPDKIILSLKILDSIGMNLVGLKSHSVEELKALYETLLLLEGTKKSELVQGLSTFYKSASKKRIETPILLRSLPTALERFQFMQLTYKYPDNPKAAFAMAELAKLPPEARAEASRQFIEKGVLPIPPAAAAVSPAVMPKPKDEAALRAAMQARALQFTSSVKRVALTAEAWKELEATEDMQRFTSFIPHFKTENFKVEKQFIKGTEFNIINYTQHDLVFNDSLSLYLDYAPVKSASERNFSFTPDNCNLCLWEEEGVIRLINRDVGDFSKKPTLILLTPQGDSVKPTYCSEYLPIPPFKLRPIEGVGRVVEDYSGGLVTVSDTGQLFVNGLKVCDPGTDPDYSEGRTFSKIKKFRFERQGDLLGIFMEGPTTLFGYYVDLKNCVHGIAYQLLNYRPREITLEEVEQKIKKLEIALPHFVIETILYNRHGVAAFGLDLGKNMSFVIWANPSEERMTHLCVGDRLRRDGSINESTNEFAFSWKYESAKLNYEPAQVLKLT